MASITCTAASGNVVRESGSTLGCSAIPVTAPMVNTTGTLSMTDFVASGGSHAAGKVPDPGATAGTAAYLREDSTWVNPWLDASSLHLYDEFCGKWSNSPFITGGSGAGNAVGDVNGPGASHPCMGKLSTGTTTTGIAGMEMVQTVDDNNITLGTDAFTLQWGVQVPTLSTAGEEFIVRCGFCDRNTAACAGGDYFEYDRLSSTAWRIVTNNGATTKATTGNTVTAGQTDQLKIVVNAANSSVAFFIAGSQVTGSPLTTTLPGNVTIGCQIQKSAGTTSRDVYVDYVQAYQKIAASR
jgi:hypothetical protein